MKSAREIYFLSKSTREIYFLGLEKTDAYFLGLIILQLIYVTQNFWFVSFVAFPLDRRLDTVKWRVKRWIYPIYEVAVHFIF